MNDLLFLIANYFIESIAFPPALFAMLLIYGRVA